jgi:hypothetical protein
MTPPDGLGEMTPQELIELGLLLRERFANHQDVMPVLVVLHKKGVELISPLTDEGEKTALMFALATVEWRIANPGGPSVSLEPAEGGKKS